MLKVVVDARATASHLRENLALLDSYRATVKSNIELFNSHMKKYCKGHNARGGEADYLIINLLKENPSVLEKGLTKCIQKKKDECSKGSSIPKN